MLCETRVVDWWVVEGIYCEVTRLMPSWEYIRALRSTGRRVPRLTGNSASNIAAAGTETKIADGARVNASTLPGLTA